jgi:hypothetical protein
VVSVRTGDPRTALEAVTWRRLLVSGWPWRSAGYLLTTLPMAAVAFAVLGIPWLVLVARMGAGDYQVGMVVLLILLGAALLAVPLTAVFLVSPFLVHAQRPKLYLPQTDDTNRRVLAVLAYLRSGGHQQ